MPWFVAKRAIADSAEAVEKYEYRVFSEAEIESIAPDWDWASSACSTREEAQALADDQFWDSLE
jgi:hypothetical protein